jgi:O-antigen ligase
MELTLRPDRPTKPWLFEVTLTLFLAGLLLQDVYAWLPPLNRLLGALLALLAIHGWSRRRGGIPAEVALFGAFVAWGVLTGFLFARGQQLALAYGRQLSQELVLLFALAEYVTERRLPSFAFLLLLVVPLGLWWYAHGTGQLVNAQAGSKQWRAQSFTSNANSAGSLCVYGLFGVAYYLWNRTKLGLVAWPLLVLPFIGLTLLASGSRKSILSVGIFALAWTFLAYGRGKGSKLRPILLLLMIAAALLLAGRFIVESTPVGERFRKAAATPHFDTDRYALYQDGWMMFRQSPVYGVGLGNFVNYSHSAEYAHSDSMEALATTGIVGFVLYFSIYFVLWSRLRRILRKRKDATSRYIVGLYQAMIITGLVLGLGRPSFLDSLHLYIVGVMIGHTRAMEQDLRSTRPAESGTTKDVTSSLSVSVRRASWPCL